MVTIWTLHSKKDVEILSHVQKKATNLVKGLEIKSCERLRTQGLAWRKSSSRENLLLSRTTSKEVEVDPFSQAASGRTRGNGMKLSHRRFRLDIRKHLFTERMVKHWNGLPREMVSYLVIIPRGFQEASGCGTECCGVADMVVFSQKLDLMILEVSFNFSDSVILHLIGKFFAFK